jgi:hypothetical protein
MHIGIHTLKTISDWKMMEHWWDGRNVQNNLDNILEFSFILSHSLAWLWHGFRYLLNTLICYHNTYQFKGPVFAITGKVFKDISFF